MDRAMKKWELALMVGVLAALLTGGWLEGEHQELADRVIRIHVIANSDSEADQQMKLAVRDRVLEQAKAVYPENATLEEAETVLRNNLPLLAQAGRQAVEEAGSSYPVTADIGPCWFPTKEYDGFALPAGNYTALRVVIGEGKGQNWWCVAFPPLCVGAASQTLEEAVEAGYFTPEQVSLVTEEDGGYVLKFKSMELLGRLKNWIT